MSPEYFTTKKHIGIKSFHRWQNLTKIWLEASENNRSANCIHTDQQWIMTVTNDYRKIKLQLVDKSFSLALLLLNIVLLLFAHCCHLGSGLALSKF